jgi:hypothetical protein
MGHGDRVNKFEVEIQAPSLLRAIAALSPQKTDTGKKIDWSLTSRDNKDRIMMLCKSTSLPEKEVGTVDIWRRGRKFKIRDTSQFSGSWTAEFYNDENLTLRRAFENWMFEIDRYDSLLVPTTFITNGLIVGYMGDIYIHKKNNKNQDNITYRLRYAFPIRISETSLSTEGTGVSTFTVTFAYSYWKPESNTTFSLGNL